jgi:hypothetical protein
MERLDVGLFTLQHVDYIIGVICTASNILLDKSKELLELQGHSLDDVVKYIGGTHSNLILLTVAEYSSNLGGRDVDTTDSLLKRSLEEIWQTLAASIKTKTDK